MKRLALAVLVLLIPMLAQAGEPSASPLAWIRFEDGQEYKGRTYYFLGQGDLRLTINVTPASGQVIELLWGAKNKETRSGLLMVNGQAIRIQHGGYDGFDWLRVPLPANLAGSTLDVLLQHETGQGKAPFIAELRLAGAASSTAPVDTRPAIHKVVVQTGRASAGGEAFPEMRKLWDREPPAPASMAGDEVRFRLAEKNARQVAEGYYRCIRFVEGWLKHADPKTGLIPRNLNKDKDRWNGRDSAADNYPFMVLTSFFTDRAMFDGRMLDILKTEKRLTARVDRLCDDYSFTKQGWHREKLDLDAIIFDSAEYVKDGLLPLTEWLGKSPWSDRMIELIDDIWKNAQVDTPHGKIPTLNFEVNGDLLQANARLFFFTGDRQYLDWAIRIGDYYLLGDKEPVSKMDRLALSDHACEMINGLSELYVACSVAAPEKRAAYRKPLHDLYDRVLKHGVNEHGQMYVWMNSATGEHGKSITDNWGYNYDGLYTVYLLDKVERYRDAVRHALANLKANYTCHSWQGGSADGFADSIEGAINLLNREPNASAFEWVDSEIRTMWSKQKPDGVIEGWHGDGNSARTTIMYCLWKSQGTWVGGWRPDVRLGAVRDGEEVLLSLSADQAWSGRLFFDKPRHRTNLHLPLDYPRINQFPEWFVTEADRQYLVRDAAGSFEKRVSGADLQQGLPLNVKAGGELRLRVLPVR